MRDHTLLKRSEIAFELGIACSITRVEARGHYAAWNTVRGFNHPILFFVYSLNLIVAILSLTVRVWKHPCSPHSFWPIIGCVVDPRSCSGVGDVSSSSDESYSAWTVWDRPLGINRILDTSCVVSWRNGSFSTWESEKLSRPQIERVLLSTVDDACLSESYVA